MKRVVISLCCAVLMIVMICAIVLPAYADSPSVNAWLYGVYAPDDADTMIMYEWNYFDIGVVEGYNGEVAFQSAKPMYFSLTKGIGAEMQLLSYTILLTSIRFDYSYGGLPEQLRVYSGDNLILRWSYADPEKVYLYQPGVTNPYQSLDIDEDIDRVVLWTYNNSLYTVTNGFTGFNQMFGDLTIHDYFLEDKYYNTGYQLGFVDGEDIGYDSGYSIGYDEGYYAGQVVGSGLDYDAIYQRGYDEAIKEIDSGEFGQNLIGNTLMAPLNALNSFVLYEVVVGGVELQVTLGSILFGLIGVILFVCFLKMFAGG